MLLIWSKTSDSAVSIQERIWNSLVCLDSVIMNFNWLSWFYFDYCVMIAVKMHKQFNWLAQSHLVLFQSFVCVCVCVFSCFCPIILFILNSAAFKINYAHLFETKRSLINHLIIIICVQLHISIKWYQTLESQTNVQPNEWWENCKIDRNNWMRSANMFRRWGPMIEKVPGLDFYKILIFSWKKTVFFFLFFSFLNVKNFKRYRFESKVNLILIFSEWFVMCFSFQIIFGLKFTQQHNTWPYL